MCVYIYIFKCNDDWCVYTQQREYEKISSSEMERTEQKNRETEIEVRRE